MARMSIEKVAKKAFSDTRCDKCPFNMHSTRCNFKICEVCESAYIKGFKKGAKYSKSV